MATFTQRIKVSNERPPFVTLWLEPWGEDYGMPPGDELEVIAIDAEEGFYFHIEYGGKGVKVYAEGAALSVAVYQAGELLSCGRDRREEAW